MHRLTTLLVASLLAPPALRADVQGPDPDLVAGIRQVKEGDFETALLTLDGVARKLTGDPGRARDLAQAHLYLGIACLALDQREPAKAQFRAAVEGDRDLRLPPDRFSPKVIAAFEEARREAVARRGGESHGGGGAKTALVVLGVGGAAAAIVVVAKGGGSDTPGAVRFMNARFGTPVIECPNGSNGAPINFTILVDAQNTTSSPATIQSVTATVIIEASAIPSEIGQASSLPAAAAPDTLAIGGTSTVSVGSALRCFNDPGNAPRFNEWSGHVTLTTSAGVTTLATADRLRVNVP